jgi:hypothetical protein
MYTHFMNNKHQTRMRVAAKVVAAFVILGMIFIYVALPFFQAYGY